MHEWVSNWSAARVVHGHVGACVDEGGGPGGGLISPLRLLTKRQWRPPRSTKGFVPSLARLPSRQWEMLLEGGQIRRVACLRVSPGHSLVLFRLQNMTCV